MLQLPRPQKLAGGRLARRLYALFVAAALLPLALSDWVSTRAVADVVEELHQRGLERNTRMVSRAVLDRLITAHDLLLAMPPADRRPGSVPGLGTVFRHIRYHGNTAGADWTLSAPGVNDGEQFPWPPLTPEIAMAPAGEPTSVRLWAHPAPSRQPPLLMHAYVDGRLRWQAELEPRHVWGPIVVDNPDTRWRVLNGKGRTLLAYSGDDTPDTQAAAGQDGDAIESQGVLRTAVSQLPLAGVFGSGQWSFDQRSAREPVRWLGAELSSWLLGLATLTVLGAALVAHWRIRQLFEPLEALTAGTRRLAAGDTGARVQASSNDEIGALAGSFNDMAQRIDHQLSALRAMASIDHDILTGEPLERIAERVVRQLATWLPEASIVLSWYEADGMLHSCRSEGTGSSDVSAQSMVLRMSAVRLELADRQAFEALGHDSITAVTPIPPPPWLPPLPSGDHPELHLLPIRPGGSTLALLALGWQRAPTPQRLRPAAELRDRLAVALAARGREHELLHRAMHDSLTGLANRDGLTQRLDQLLRRPDGHAAAEPLALLMVDLDHFKDINDSLGHGVGDAVLRLCAERLQTCVPPSALVARLGGDEFVLLLPGAAASEALAAGTLVLDRLRQPVRTGDRESVLGASIGIALAPLHGDTPLELLRRADIALYAAKNAGRDCLSVFDDSMDRAASERLQLHAELRLAVERREFVLHYQPRVQADTGIVTSAEALVRWQHPSRGLLYPDAFIEQSEAAGLMDELGALVLDVACRQAAVWQQQQLGLHRVSVNVSPQQLQSGRFPSLVRRVLARHQLPATALELEVTESLLVHNPDNARRQLAALRDMGISIALDDFGTGYSSMSMLRQLPIDVMKIDRAFVTDLDTDGSALAIVRAIVSLADTMGMDVVAEGVETEGHVHRLRELGCQELQGYYFARPLPPAALEQHVRAQQQEQRPHPRPPAAHTGRTSPEDATLAEAGPG
jgi:diguanylate cyclase